MQQLPKIARERLQAASRSNHPDPDVLTAFSEQALPASERAMVMEHLARCGDCREVIALALPELEEVDAPLALPRPWLNMPILRWGAIAVAFVVIFSVGVVRFRQRSSGNITAKLGNPKLENTKKAVVEPPAPAATRDEVKADASSVATGKTSGVAEPKTLTRAFAAKAQPTNSNAPSPQPAPHAGRLQAPLTASTADGLNTVGKQSVADEGLLVKNAPATAKVPAQTEVVEVASAAPAVSTEQSSLDSTQNQTQVSGQQSQLAQLADAQSSQQLPINGRSISMVAKAKPSTAAQGIGSGVATRNSAAQLAPSATVSGYGPRWMITSTGGLRRSYDQGKTWQDVSMIANPFAASLPPPAEAASPRFSQKAAKRIEPSKPASLPIIRTISVSGLEIWAGASGGTLYHSLDAGDHWTSAIPSQGGVPLTGDIVSVQFSDALHGKVGTSTAESWTTDDGGQRWSKQ